MESNDKTQRMFEPRRVLGQTGFVATRLGIGDLADRAVPLERCVATARRALEAGLNVIDTAPSYEDGYSEQIVGRALKEFLGAVMSRRREQLFVIDKIDHHDQPVEPQVDGSLARLGLEHVDLFVFHGLSTMEGWRRITEPGDGMDQLGACVRASKLRFRGISSHHPLVLREAILSGLCDVVMFAIGPYVDARYVEDVLPLAKKRGVGTVCFKTFGAGKLVADTSGYNKPLVNRPRGKMSSGGATSPGAGDGGDGPALPHLTAVECVHYTLACDPDVALLGMSFPNEQDAAFAAACSFVPHPAETLADIRRRAVEAIREKGPSWWNPPETR